MRVRRVLTTRAGGVSRGAYESFNLGHGVGDEPSAVDANRRRLAEGIGLAPRRLVWMSQVHGTSAAYVDGPRPAAVPDTDALVTDRVSLALVALTADCVPILLADPTAGVIAVAHAGRPGARAGIATAVLSAMAEHGARPGRTEVLLGPAVCGACYEVPATMQADVEERLPGSACRTRRGTTGLDLRAGLHRQLAAAGVARIGVDPRCTAEDPDLYSYRRDGTTGRLAAVTWLDPS
ncbi:MAG TPA: peptidoglycan editing factor PgeF [Pseudonocardiaceae bacterium]